jgi:cobalt-zinc-cadmium efflux system outer membrane protein
MIIDDEQNFTESLQLAIEDAFSVPVASSLQAAREALKVNMPDAILLDVNLPDGEGLELLREFGKSGRMPIVIVMIAYATLESGTTAMKAGAVEYFIKSLDIEKLKRELKTHLKKTADRLSIMSKKGCTMNRTAIKKISFVKLLFISTFSLLPMISFAEQASSLSTIMANVSVMSLDELVEQMRQNNPQLKQAEQNYFAAKAVVPQVTAWNNPQVGLIQNPIPGSPFNLGQSQGFNYTLTQSFSFPGKKRLAGDIAEDQANIVKTQENNLYLQLLAQLKNGFYQLLVLQRQSDANQDNIKRLEQIKQIAKVRYSNNAAAYVEYLNAQVARSSAENDEFALQRQIDTARQTLNTLIGRNPLTPLSIKGGLAAKNLPKRSLEEIENLAIDFNPQVKGSALQVSALNKGVDLAKKQYLPDFQIIFTNISDNPPWGFRHVSNYGVEFDIVLPTWFLTKERAGVAEANANLLASRANDQSIVHQTRLMVDSIYNALAQAVNQSNFIRTRQLEEAKIAYRLSLTNYANGTTAFADLLTAQGNLRTTDLALIQSEYSGVQAYINLVAAVGVEIE